MANYEPFFRSNYFAVKDPEAFKKFCELHELDLFQDGDKPFYGFCGNGESGIPHDAGDGSETDIDFMAELAKHLVDDHVAVVIEIGHEKMRYLVGYALAINSKGETAEVSVDDIYAKAKLLGSNVTDCSY